jgi:ABC-type branched-subunit amino acid transport system substrate-binding protein
VIPLVATLIAAVGGGCAWSSGSPAPQSAAACDSPGVSPNRVTVGLIYPSTGTSATTFAQYRAGIDARLGEQNDAGGVYGRTINYDWADDRTDANTNLAVAKQLVEQRKVFGIVEGTTVADGGAAYLHQQAMPTIGTSVELAWTKYDNMFSYSNFITSGPAISTWGTYARAKGASRAAVMFSSFNQTSRTFRDKFVASLEAAGVAVVDQFDAEPESLNDAALAARLKAENVDALVGATDPIMFITAASVARALGVNLKVVLAPTGYDPSVLSSAAGKLLAGRLSIFVPAVPFEEKLPVHKRFFNAMALYSPQVQPPNAEIAIEGWLSADLLITGLKAAGPCPTRAGFIRSLRNVKDYDAGGFLLKPVDMRANFGKPNSCYAFVEINQAGTGWDVVPPKVNCGHLLAPSTGQ